MKELWDLRLLCYLLIVEVVEGLYVRFFIKE